MTPCSQNSRSAKSSWPIGNGGAEPGAASIPGALFTDLQSHPSVLTSHQPAAGRPPGGREGAGLLTAATAAGIKVSGADRLSVFRCSRDRSASSTEATRVGRWNGNGKDMRPTPGQPPGAFHQDAECPWPSPGRRPRAWFSYFQTPGSLAGCQARGTEQRDPTGISSQE